MAYILAAAVLVGVWAFAYCEADGTKVSRSVVATMVTWAAGALPALIVFAVAGGTV